MDFEANHFEMISLPFIAESTIFVQKQMILSPSKLAKEIYGEDWQEAKHIELLDNLLVRISKREFDRLVVNMPPRHGKTELVSKIFPFWYIGNFPKEKIMLVTYQNQFSQQYGKIVRELISEFGAKYFGIELNKRDASSKMLRIGKTNGTIYFVGAMGAITGRGANLIIIDDPIKNDREAMSLNRRESLWDWFKATVFTRLEPNGIMVIVMTRWHEDDLVGRILKFFNTKEITKDGNINEKNRNVWYVLKLPAISTNESDALGRAIGEPLWQERFPLQTLWEIKQTLGDFWFSAIYQQEPKSTRGKIFDRSKFQYFEYHGNYIQYETKDKINFKKEIVFLNQCRVFATVDLAIQSKETNDYTVAIVFAVSKDRRVFVLEVIRERFDSAYHKELIQSIYSKWKPVLIGIESVQYQASLVKILRSEGFPIKELRPDRDKISRCLPMVAMMEAEMVFFNRYALWLETFEDELLNFPNGKNDDQVDAFAYIAQLIDACSNNFIATSKIKLQESQWKKF